MPPITTAASTARDSSAGNWVAVTSRQASAHSTPAVPARNPEMHRAPTLTVVGVTRKVAARFSSSRTAIMSLPGWERRRAHMAAPPTTTTPKAT